MLTKAINIYLRLGIIILFSAGIVLAKEPPLNQATATRLAIKSANDSCLVYYKAAPFDTVYAKAIYKKTGWIWGALNRYTSNGYSAQVQFDRFGKKLSVKLNRITDINDNKKLEEKLKEPKNQP
jgi:hypothetical protein